MYTGADTSHRFYTTKSTQITFNRCYETNLFRTFMNDKMKTSFKVFLLRKIFEIQTSNLPSRSLKKIKKQIKNNNTRLAYVYQY